jgi:hypothetical protein
LRSKKIPDRCRPWYDWAEMALITAIRSKLTAVEREITDEMSETTDEESD